MRPTDHTKYELTRIPMRLLVCGGRDIHDRRVVWKAIENYTEYCLPDILITGDCRGVDRWATDWAKDNGVPVMVFYADRSLGQRAEEYRNGRMIVEGKPTHVLGLWGGRGTANLLERAREYRIPVEEKLTVSKLTAAKVREPGYTGKKRGPGRPRRNP